MNIAFWGSPEISAKLLENLLESGVTVAFVVTQKDKARSQRGQQILPSPVKIAAIAKEIPVYSFGSLKKPENITKIQNLIREHQVSINVVLAYGKILPLEILEAPPLKSVNFHASLLPKLRGASPIESALLAGYSVSGWTLQRITEELDAGDILAQSEILIEDADDRGRLYEKLEKELWQRASVWLRAYAANQLKAKPQANADATFCGKFIKADFQINWQNHSREIRNRLRAFSPAPGCFCKYRGFQVKIWANFLVPLKESEKKFPPGTLVDFDRRSNLLWVACGDGLLLAISHLQPANKKRQLASEFVNGFQPELGISGFE